MSQCRKRLLLFAPNLYGGGAERTLSRLANHWASQGRFVTVLTISNIHPNDYPLSPGVERIGLGLTSNGGFAEALRGNYERMRGVRWAIKEIRPEVVVSFIDQANILALLAARPLDVPVVISERTDPSRHPIGAPWRWLRRHTYRRAANLVVLTRDVAEAMSAIVPSERVVVIPNAVDAHGDPPPSAMANGAVEGVPRDKREPDDDSQTGEAEREKVILAVGRLDPAKGFDRLIEAVSLLIERREFDGWRVVLAGSGPAREELEEQAARLPAGSVEFLGRVSDPTEWYRRAGLFALPSRYEGFPNALLEAMSWGLPAVAFENSATRQIIRHDWDGLLVPEGDSGSLAHAISRLLADTAHRETLGRAARDVSRRFPQDETWHRWDTVVDQATLAEPPDSRPETSLAGE